MGTYSLPEAQLDRFLFTIVVDYPSAAEEDDILRLHCRPQPLEAQVDAVIRPVLDPARGLAAFAGRSYVIPDDVQELVLPALRHRVILTPEAEVVGETTDGGLTALLATVEVPRP